jgi:hypothetical protein
VSYRFIPLSTTSRKGILEDGDKVRVARFLSLSQAKAEHKAQQRKDRAA